MTAATILHAPAVARDRNGLAAFAAGLRDLAFWPGDAGYHEACRIWNRMIERRPALVVRPQDADQLPACIGFVRDRGLPLSIRGGGHNIAGTALCDRGLMIDFSTRRTVEVDPSNGRVRVQPGATWADVGGARPDRLRDRRRRLHAGRRLRLGQPALRVRRRQPARGRDRHR